MIFENEEISQQFNKIILALQIAEEELDITLQEHHKTDYMSQEDFYYVQYKLDGDRSTIRQAMEIVEEWAFKLDN